MPHLYIIAGCNGAGKTTASFNILPTILDCQEFVNADEIARGLSPFNPDKSKIEAGKIMLRKIDELITKKVDFAVETTLSGRTYIKKINKARAEGYTVTLHYFWLETADIAKERVRKRVKEGGHNIPEETIECRYYRGISNLFTLYMPICDHWEIYNNTKKELQDIAHSQYRGITIDDETAFKNIQEMATKYHHKNKN